MPIEKNPDVKQKQYSQTEKRRAPEPGDGIDAYRKHHMQFCNLDRTISNNASDESHKEYEGQILHEKSLGRTEVRQERVAKPYADNDDPRAGGENLPRTYENLGIPLPIQQGRPFPDAPTHLDRPFTAVSERFENYLPTEEEKENRRLDLIINALGRETIIKNGTAESRVMGKAANYLLKRGLKGSAVRLAGENLATKIRGIRDTYAHPPSTERTFQQRALVQVLDSDFTSYCNNFKIGQNEELQELKQIIDQVNSLNRTSV